MVLISYLCPEVISVIRGFIIEDDKLQQYAELFKKEIGRSMNEETSEESGVNSYVTYVNKLPTGTEEGTYIALDFGGPTVRIMLVHLTKERCNVTCQSFQIPPKYMVGKSERLFNFIASCLSEFLKTVKLKMLRIPVGVTFGFPIEQLSLQNCRLLRWTKGFECNDMVGKNVFTKLKDSMRKYPNLKRVYIIGVLNETVSLLLASTVEYPRCRIGITIGHVACCCYAEKICCIGKYQAESFREKYMYMNIDSGSFGEDGCLDHLRTEFDIRMDAESTTPGKLVNEKLTSLTYMGEIARLALLRCIEAGLILDGVLSSTLNTKSSFDYTHMIRIESDPEKQHDGCRSVMKEFGYDSVSDHDCIQIQFLCRCVSRRAASLIAAQLSALMNRINDPEIGITMDGEMIRNYPNFEWYLTRKLNQLKKQELQVLKLDEDALGRGAAVMASVFAEKVMNRDEKLRRLPGFPVARCHFRKTGKCLNPNCSMRHPCDTSGVNPLQNPVQTKSQDLSQCFDQSHCPKKNHCVGYDQL